MNQSWSWLPGATMCLLASAAVAALAVWPTLPDAADRPAQPAPAMAGMAMPPAAAHAEIVPTAPTAADAVTIENFAYAPAALTVKAGTTVTWTNQDQDPHTVTSADGGPLHSPTLTNGQSFQYTFTTPGHFDYLCSVHPFMTATVVVTQ
jgi:plastocyanin